MKNLLKIILVIYLCFFEDIPSILAGEQNWTSGGPINGREMDLAINASILYTSGYNGVWKSEDKGASWVEKNNGIPTPYDVNNIEIGFNNNYLYITTWTQGVYKSIDNGNNWFKLNSFPGNYIRKMRVDTNNGNILYIGTGSGSLPGTIYKSTNGGDTWQELNLGTKGIIAYIVIEPANTQVITTGILGGSKPGRYKSIDGGNTWNQISTETTINFPDFPTSNPLVFYKITNNKLYKTKDNGFSWQETQNLNLPNNFTIRYLTIDHFDENKIFLFSTNYGVYVSNDGGNNWETINNGLFGALNLSLFQDLYIDREQQKTLYITTNGAGVWQYSLYSNIPIPTLTPTPEPTPTSTPVPTATPTPIPTPTPTPIQPIIILPGLGTSWNHENMILGIEKPQSDWFMTPGVKVYDGLINTLKNANYQTEGEDKNLFIFNYNWTKPLESNVEDFKNYIENIVRPLPEQKIDLIGHSLGGLIARIYIQNNPNNNIDQLITLGSPHKGIPSLYYPWEGGDLSKSLPGWQRIGAGLLVHLRKPGFSTTMEAVRSTIPSLKNLLPTFNYLKENSTEKILDNMTEKNEWLININNNLPSHLFSSLHTVAGVSTDNTIRWVKITERNWLDKILGLWIDGKPQSEEKAQGDWTVLEESAILPGGKINNLDNLSHMELVTSPLAQQKIMEYLGLSPTSISETSASLNYDSALVFQIASPARIDLFDSSNNPVGSGDGKLMVLPNPQNDQYQIKLTGTDQGQYQLYVGLINNQKDSWETIFGDINLNEENIYKLDFDNTSSEIVITSEKDNLYLKNAQAKISELEGYISSKDYGKIIKKIILFSFSIINHSLEKNKIEKAITGLYHLRYQINLLQKSKNLNENEALYLKNKIMEIINDLEKSYLQSENNKNKKHYLSNLKQEIKIAQRMFEQMENKLKKLANRNSTKTEYGVVYLLAQEKLNKALNTSTPSLEAYINALGARYLSGEFIFFK